MKIDTIKPEIFSDENRLNVFFTFKNEKKYSGDRAINGLNLGFNTGETPEIIKENRRDLLDAFGIEAEWTAFANQVHSNRVKVVTKGGTFAETDGLITQVPGLALAIQVADCAAVLLADMQSRTIAAVHAGWRGAAGDIVPKALDKMKSLGADAADCRAFISPCISSEEFEVGPEVADRFPDEYVNSQTYAKPHLNLKAFLADQLAEAGLKPASIETHSGCTVQDDQFYSFRREGKQSGRMMAIMQLKQMSR
jgi:YfiH family protein